MTRCHHTIDSPIGPLTLVAVDGALEEIRFPNGPQVSAGDGPDEPADPVLADAARQLHEYFDGTRRSFDLPLRPVGTPFQVIAWQGLTAIPFGETVTYGEQARRLGHDGKARAVGAANGRNPLPIVMPCHRVVGSDGSLVGFGGGIETKSWLLHHERQVLGIELPLS
jgi:methylated-DNA-[protein]-cysteine S-methyltransferase